MPKPILAIDQGTTGTTALVVDPAKPARTLGRATTEFAQIYPRPGWVSHDVGDILESVAESVQQALSSAGVRRDELAAIGITNQRETTVLWDRATRKPMGHAIVWQCRRTAEACDELKRDPARVAWVREKTGLVIDAYFSATKIAWLLDESRTLRERAEAGEIAFGTVDSLLVSEFTAGEVHVTDITNASRTLLMDLRSGEWDPALLSLFRVPSPVLPRIVGCAEVVGRTRGLTYLPDGIPIAGIAGDQHAALFGQACFREGDAKCTYGTGAFALMNIGPRPMESQHGLVTTVAWRIGGKTTYALEGSAFIAGAAVQWLRDGLGLFSQAGDIEALARSVPSSEGVVFVPALAGLGAPYWDQDARGIITGLTRATTAAHLARATLEGIALEVRDLLAAMAADARRPIARLRVDGGACQNDLLMQFQADVAEVTLERPLDVESTGRGAAMLAAIGAGLCAGQDEAAGWVDAAARFAPVMSGQERAGHLARWREAVARARSTALQAQ